MTRVMYLTYRLAIFAFITPGMQSLSMEVKNRRHFIRAVSTAALLSSAHDSIAMETFSNNSDENMNYRETRSQLEAKTVLWTDPSEIPSFNKSRYRSSSLSTSSDNYAPSSVSPILYPDWMEGYWAMTYKFNGASFPQGRKVLSLRTAGAGIGTCLSLPNVGMNPPTFSSRFLKVETDLHTSTSVHEDLAYNTPRRFEAFWPQSKVLSVQTNASLPGVENGNNRSLSPKCSVTGVGCTKVENPNLHLPASRFVMDFEGPTRRSGRLTQSCDVSLVNGSFGMNGDSYVANKSFSQYNANQELQTFYKEIVSFEKVDEKGIEGRIRVAAFLPKNIREFDASENYDENEAVVLYDYKLFMKRIDDFEAFNL